MIFKYLNHTSKRNKSRSKEQDGIKKKKPLVIPLFAFALLVFVNFNF